MDAGPSRLVDTGTGPGGIALRDQRRFRSGGLMRDSRTERAARDDRLGVDIMTDFFGILAAGPAFFLSAWLLMIFAGITAADVGIHPFGYLTSMVVTIGLWLVIAPAAGAIARTLMRSGAAAKR